MSDSQYYSVDESGTNVTRSHPAPSTRVRVVADAETSVKELEPARLSDSVRYFTVLEQLHRKRRELLSLKRLNDSAFNPEELQELRDYIDKIQRPLVRAEEKPMLPVMDRLEQITKQLIARES